MPFPIEAQPQQISPYVVDIRDTYLANAYGYPAQQGADPSKPDEGDCFPVNGGAACVRSRLTESKSRFGLDFYLPQSHDDDSTEFVDALAAHLTSRGIPFDPTSVTVIMHDRDASGDQRGIYVGGLTPEQIEAIGESDSASFPLSNCLLTLGAATAGALVLYGLYRGPLTGKSAKRSPQARPVPSTRLPFDAQRNIPSPGVTPVKPIEERTAVYRRVLRRLEEEEAYRPEPAPSSPPAPSAPSPRPIVPTHSNQRPQAHPEESFRATGSIPRQPRIIGLPGETQAHLSGDSLERSSHIARIFINILYRVGRFDAARKNPHGDPLVESPAEELKLMNKGFRRLRKLLGLS